MRHLYAARTIQGQTQRVLLVDHGDRLVEFQAVTEQGEARWALKLNAPEEVQRWQRLMDQLAQRGQAVLHDPTGQHPAIQYVLVRVEHGAMGPQQG